MPTLALHVLRQGYEVTPALYTIYIRAANFGIYIPHNALTLRSATSSHHVLTHVSVNVRVLRTPVCLLTSVYIAWVCTYVLSLFYVRIVLQYLTSIREAELLRQHLRMYKTSVLTLG